MFTKNKILKVTKPQSHTLFSKEKFKEPFRNELDGASIILGYITGSGKNFGGVPNVDRKLLGYILKPKSERSLILPWDATNCSDST